MSKREERIQNLAAGLLIAGRSPIDAFHAAQAFVNICEARDAAEAEAEATQEPDEDPKLALYINAVRELVPGADLREILYWHYLRATPEVAAIRCRDAIAKSRFEFGDESERDGYVADVVDQIADATEATHDPGEDHEFESYLSDVRELVPGADRYIIQCWHTHNYTPQQCAEKWLAFVAFTEQQRKGVNP